MYADVEYTIIDECRFYVYLDLERGSFPVRASAEQVGISVINDYVNAQLAVGEDCYPGLFLMPGRHDKQSIMDSPLIHTARAYQLNWYEALVKLADDDWEQYHQHRVISHVQRVAARVMGLERDWLFSPPTERKADSVICLVCRSQLEPETILCPQCNFIVDPERFEQIKDRFLGKPGVGVHQMNSTAK
jgi:hypothetical protein